MESTLEKEPWLPETSMEINRKLLDMLNQGNYSFSNPLVVLDPYHNSPLSAVVLFKTPRPYRVQVTVKGDKPEYDIKGATDMAVLHHVPVIGLYAGRENKVILKLLEEDGWSKIVELSIATSNLPPKLQNAVRHEKFCGNSAYHLTLVSGKNTPYPFAFDPGGSIRWYFNKPCAGYGLFPLSNHRILFPEKNVFTPTEEKPHTTHMYEADFLGRFFKVYRVEKGYHHDVVEKTPGGNLIALSNTINGSVENTVIEIDRMTGKIIKTLDLRKIFGNTYVDRPNWIHLNTVSYNEKTNTVLLSARNLHSGLKINWATDELIWILCNPKFWKKTPFQHKVLKPIGDINWHYQQHTVYEVDADLDGNPDTTHVILFDNHWHKRRKVKFFDGNEQTSFVVLYHINEKDMTVTQGKRYEGTKSKITSNSIIEYEKKRVFFMGGYLDPLVEGRKAMIYEFDYDSKEILNQYSLKYFFYRAYEMKLNFSDMAQPMKDSLSFIKGDLRNPKLRRWNSLRVWNKLTLPDLMLPKDCHISFTIRGRELLLLSQDHNVKHVMFFGKKYVYEYDLSDTEQTEEIFKKLHYKIAIPISKMKSDEYQIGINYKGTDYNTGEIFDI